MTDKGKSPSPAHRRLKPYPSYKDSGVEWLGKIPAHWEARRLKYLSRIIMGQSPPSDIVNALGEGRPFLQGNADFGTEHPTARTFCSYPPKVAAPEDILISVRAPVGAINSADREYGIGRGLCAIRPFIRQLARRFCSYLLQIARFQLDSIATGSTYDAVSADDVSCLMLSMPSIEEQHRISYFLDRETAKIDALIEKKDRLIELLQEKRTALITQAVTKGLDPSVPMKDSGVEWLGKIPAHWEVKRLKYVSRIIMGQSPPSDIVNILGDGLPFLQGNADFGAEHPTARTFCPFPNKVAAPKDILVSVRAPVGAINIADREYGIGRGLCAIRPYFLQLEPRYCSNFLQIAHPQLNSIATGSTYDAVSSDDVSCLAFPLPPIEEQHSISYFLDRETAKIDKLISRIREAITQLREYRAALISAAVTGKINVREA